MHEEQDRVMDHDYDGIQEFDNRLPNWWLYTLYGSIVFAALYWITFHTWQWSPLPHRAWHEDQVAAAERQLAAMAEQEISDEALELMATVPATIERGRQVFDQFCVVCHRADGSGSVGPNLTDDYFLHGNRPMQMLDTVTNGVPDKGMAAWGGQLGPNRVQDVVAYVLTLRGRNLPGKEPEGELIGDSAEEAPLGQADAEEATEAVGS